jgi:DeoR/GlpR family transcriptional regulator of sugar metabolism
MSNTDATEPVAPSASQLFDYLTPGEAYTVRELDDHFDANPETLRNRLKTLADNGYVTKKVHGHRTVTYTADPDPHQSEINPTTTELLDYLTPGEPYTVPELDDHFDASHETIRTRLQSLIDSGHVTKKSHGDKTATYRLHLTPQ